MKHSAINFLSFETIERLSPTWLIGSNVILKSDRSVTLKTRKENHKAQVFIVTDGGSTNLTFDFTEEGYEEAKNKFKELIKDGIVETHKELYGDTSV